MPAGDPDSELQPFSFMTDAPMHNKVECWIAYTNPETHKIILDNIQRSPLYGGMIEASARVTAPPSRTRWCALRQGPPPHLCGTLR